MEPGSYDLLKLNDTKEIKAIIKDEKIYYSNKINKINHYNISQERNLILTNLALYNIQKKKCKRRILYNEIRGITFSRTSQEFVIHGNDSEYDYYYSTPDKNILICIIAKWYQENTKSILKICETNDKCLKNFVTGKKEKKKSSDNTKMDETYIINTRSFMRETLRDKKNLRKFLDFEDYDQDKPDKNKTTIIFNKLQGITTVELDELNIIKILGRGTWGNIYLVQFNQMKEQYSMKTISKESVINQYDIENKLKNLEKLNHPFLINIKLIFTTFERIYFIMDYIKGENLSSYLRKNDNCFNEKQIQLFASIVGITLDYLHKNGIIFKDLTLDNIIIENNGYLKIAAFKTGEFLQLKNQLKKEKETSESLAPEVISNNKFDQAVDWWSYGIILFQLLFGVPPFYDIDNSKMEKKILNDELVFPKFTEISENISDLLKKLLIKNPSERLGGKDGFEEIKKHPFFEGINFDDIINKKVDIEYKPTVENAEKERKNFIEFTYEDLINSQLSN